MIGFVTWPHFLYQNYYTGGQVTRPIVKNMLYIIVRMSFKELKVFLIKYVTSWPHWYQSFWLHLPAYMLLLIGLALLYTQNLKCTFKANPANSHSIRIECIHTQCALQLLCWLHYVVYKNEMDNLLSIAREQCENGCAAVFNIVVVSWVLHNSFVVSVSWNEKDIRIKHMKEALPNWKSAGTTATFSLGFISLWFSYGTQCQLYNDRYVVCTVTCGHSSSPNWRLSLSFFYLPSRFA